MQNGNDSEGRHDRSLAAATDNVDLHLADTALV